MLESTDNQIAETAEVSGSPGSSTPGSTMESTGSSTAPVEPVQALDVPHIPKMRSSAYHEKKYTYEELKKLLPAGMKKRISRHFVILAKRAKSTSLQVLEAEQFFAKEFPNRSPFGVYQKAMEMKRDGKKRILLV